MLERGLIGRKLLPQHKEMQIFFKISVSSNDRLGKGDNCHVHCKTFLSTVHLKATKRFATLPLIIFKSEKSSNYANGREFDGENKKKRNIFPPFLKRSLFIGKHAVIM
jgi:hypothetical protein